MARVKSKDIQFDMSEDEVEAAGDELVYGEELESDESTSDEDDDALAVTRPMDYKPLKLPAEKLEQMRAEYEYVVLQDFGDDYDLTAEEMRERYQFYAVFERLRTMQSKYRNLANYIHAFREAMKCLEAVAEDNQVYSKKKFIMMVLSGDIKVSGLKFPKYNGVKNVKSVNWEKVVEYILDESLDPEDLVKKENQARFEIATEDDVQQISDSYFGGDIEGELEEAHNDIAEDEFVDEDSDDLDGVNVLTPMSIKEEKNFLKIHRSALEGIKQFGIDRKATGKQLRDFSFQIARKDFDEFAKIDKIDKSRGMEYMDIPIFTGDIADEDDVERYMRALEEYELYHTRVAYRNKTITLAEANELELKDMMDESGWNVRAMYNYAEDEKKEKRKLARMEKKRKKMKKRLLKLEEITSGKRGINTKKKKHKKDTKLKDQMHKGIDKTLSAGYDSFESMQKMMEGWDDD